MSAENHAFPLSRSWPLPRSSLWHRKPLGGRWNSSPRKSNDDPAPHEISLNELERM